MTISPDSQVDGVQTIDRVFIAVLDLDIAESAYEALLDTPCSWRSDWNDGGIGARVFQLADITLELISPIGEHSDGDWLRDLMTNVGEGLVGCGLSVDDIDRFASRLNSHGIDPGPIQDAKDIESKSGSERRWRWLRINPGRMTHAFLSALEAKPPTVVDPIAKTGGPGGLTRLDHIVLNTADPEQAIAVFGQAMGARLALDKSFEKWGSRLQFFRVGRTTFEVASKLGDVDRSAPDRFYGLAFQTEDIETARGRLADLDIDVSPVRPGRKPGTKVLTVRSGTCGVPTLLIQPH